MTPLEINSRDAQAGDLIKSPAVDCWNSIGVCGDGSCQELMSVIHCRNCHIYSEAGRSLLDRESPADYKAEWTEVLSKTKAVVETAAQSVVVFMLEGECLALSTPVFREITELRTIHSLPRNRGKVVLGLVNVRGEIQLCVSLAALLGIEISGIKPGRLKQTQVAQGAQGGQGGQGRLMVVEWASEIWVIPVSSVFGTVRYNPAYLTPVPSTLEKSPATFSRGTFQWEGRTVGCLDEEIVFTALKRSLM